MDDEPPPRRRASARELTSYALVTAPSVVSAMASFVLLVALAFGEVSGALVGGPIGAALVVLWQNRPGGVADAEDDRPRRRSDQIGLSTVCGAAVADLLVAVLVLLTRRLELWTAWAAGGLLVVHVVMAVVFSRRVRERSQDPPPGYDDGAPDRPDLRWRTVPEPLRSAGFAFVVLGGVFLAVAATSVISGWEPSDAVFALVFGGALLSMAVPCAVIALDVRGCAREMALRVQLRRSTSRFPVADGALPRYVLVWRLGGALYAVGIVALALFVTTAA